MRTIKIGKGARRTLVVSLEEDDGSLAPLASLAASCASPSWSASGTVQSPNTTAKLVLDPALTGAVGNYLVTVTPVLTDGDVEPQTITVSVT